MSDAYMKKVGMSDFMYVLRRTIVPWKWREALDEALHECVRCGIDELCVFIDSGTFTHYYPDKQWLENYQKILFEIKRECKNSGLVYSLNPNVTQGHGDRGRRIDLLHPDWDMCTGSDGISATDCACCISEGWRSYVRDQWRMYAETHPAVIWIEDDIRSSFHGPAKRGCFCGTHIARFNKKYGFSFTREELVQRIFSSPSDVRTKWVAFLNDVTCEVVEMLEKTVHAVSPETVIGLMSSDVNSHAAEGRDWQRINFLMSGGNANSITASRPPLGNYEEGSLEGLRYTFNSANLTRRAFKDAKNTVYEGEIENFPYTNYSKSNTFMRLQCATAIAGGCNALTLNLFDHSGTPMASNIGLLENLGESKKYLSVLKERIPSDGTGMGVGVYWNDKSPAFKKKSFTNCSYDIYPEGHAAVDHLQRMGFGVSFEKDCEVTVLTGQDIRSASENEILGILSRGVFIDAGAFMSLCELGYSEYLGGTPVEHFPLGEKYPIAGERFFNKTFGGSDMMYFDTAIHTAHPEFVAIKTFPDAEIISELIDIERRALFPCCYIFKNSLGGRVVVHPFEYAGLSYGFSTPERKTMLYNIFKWLYGSGAIPVFMNGDRRSLAFRTDSENLVFAGFMNLSLDTLKNVLCTMSCDFFVEGVERLSEKGEWKKYDAYSLSKGLLSIQIEKLSFDAPCFLSIKILRK